MIVSLNSDGARNLSGLLFLCFHVLFLACVYTESFLFGFSQASHPRLANYKAFAMVYFVLKSDIN